MGKPTLEELEIINSRFAKETLSLEEVYVWESVVSNNLIDSYGTAMHPEQLEEYLNDVLQGVPRMVGHEVKGKIPIGRTFDGRIEESKDDRGADVYELYVKSYMRLGQKLADDLTTDDIAKGIDAGTTFAESIGITHRPGSSMQYECSICGAPYETVLWWAMPTCNHRPMRWYDEEGKEEVGEGEGQQAFAYIKNAKLAEISLVYLGAAQKAQVQKALDLVQSWDAPQYQYRIFGLDLEETRKEGDPKKGKPGTMDTSTYDNTVTGHRLCHLYWRRYTGGGGLPKNWTKSHLINEHTRCVRALLEKYNGSHRMIDGLDDTLPGDLKKKSKKKGGDKKMEDLEKGTVPVTTATHQTEAQNALIGLNTNSQTTFTATQLTFSPEHTNTSESAAVETRETNAEDNEIREIREMLGIKEGESLKEAVSEFKRLADLGREYKISLVEETIKAGVRAMGNNFDMNLYRDSIIPNLSVEQLRNLKKGFDEQARAIYSAQQETKGEDIKLPDEAARESRNREREEAVKRAEEALKRIGILKKEGDK